MERNTSLIITEEYSQFYIRLVHFKIDDYYIIPVEADSIQFHFISKNGENYKTLDIIFQKVIDEIYSGETLHPKPQFHDINNFDTLLLIELLCRLKIDNFLIYHHSKVGDKESVYAETFENRVLEYYACENEAQDYHEVFESPDFVLDDYMNYKFCKERFLKEKGN